MIELLLTKEETLKAMEEAIYSARHVYDAEDGGDIESINEEDLINDFENEIDDILNDKMLALVRADRPKRTIHSVIDFKLNQYGFYDVTVDMQSSFESGTIKHTTWVIPYPYSEYEKLPENIRTDLYSIFKVQPLTIPE
jgi:hypothetical protein